MAASVQKELMTLDEVGREVKRPYGTVRNWILDGRMTAEMKTRKGRSGKDRTYYRVPVAEVNRVKSEIERGAWF